MALKLVSDETLESLRLRLCRLIPTHFRPFRKYYFILKQRGVALMMVVTTLATISLFLVEIAFHGQLTLKLSYDRLDQVRALYMAKTGYKLSLLRLKAFQKLSEGIKAAGGGQMAGAMGFRKRDIDRIWSFPLIFPFNEIPGIEGSLKDDVDKFTAASGLKGSFTASIVSESGKFNVNQILYTFSSFDPLSGSQSSSSSRAAAGGNANQPPAGGAAAPASSSSSSAEYSVDNSRQALRELMTSMFNSKLENDEEFRLTYRDLRIEDLVEDMIQWVDFTYIRRTAPLDDEYLPKKAPLYSIQELRMLPNMDDGLYELFAPALTALATKGVNVNTLGETALRGLLPEITNEEVKLFYEFRDDPLADNTFQNEEGFYDWISKFIRAYLGSGGIQKLKEDFGKKGVRLIFDETHFRVEVVAQVNQATRRLEALVTFANPSYSRETGAAGGNQVGNNANMGIAPGGNPPVPGTAADAGLQVIYMRIF